MTVWDRWEIPCSKTMTVEQLFHQLEERYKLKPKDIIFGSMPVYLSATMDLESKKTEKQALLSKPVKDLLQLDDSAEYADITVTFTKLEGGDLLKNTPTVRLVYDDIKEIIPVEMEEPMPMPAGANAGAGPMNNSSSDLTDSEEEEAAVGAVEEEEEEE